jgi:hypothetical protein
MESLENHSYLTNQDCCRSALPLRLGILIRMKVSEWQTRLPSSARVCLSSVLHWLRGASIVSTIDPAWVTRASNSLISDPVGVVSSLATIVMGCLNRHCQSSGPWVNQLGTGRLDLEEGNKSNKSLILRSSCGVLPEVGSRREETLRMVSERPGDARESSAVDVELLSRVLSGADGGKRFAVCEYHLGAPLAETSEEASLDVLSGRACNAGHPVDRQVSRSGPSGKGDCREVGFGLGQRKVEPPPRLVTVKPLCSIRKQSPGRNSKEGRRLTSRLVAGLGILAVPLFVFCRLPGGKLVGPLGDFLLVSSN